MRRNLLYGASKQRSGGDIWMVLRVCSTLQSSSACSLLQCVANTAPKTWPKIVSVSFEPQVKPSCQLSHSLRYHFHKMRIRASCQPCEVIDELVKGKLLPPRVAPLQNVVYHDTRHAVGRVLARSDRPAKLHGPRDPALANQRCSRGAAV